MRISDWSSDVCSSDLHAQQTTCQAAVVCRNHEHGQLVTLYGMPQRHGAFWIAAYSLEHSAERRAHNASGNHVAQEEEDGHEPIHRPAAGNIDGDKAQRYLRWRQANGGATWRERGGQDGELSVVAVSHK